MLSTPNRTQAVLAALLIFMLFIIGRLAFLQIIKHDFYTERVAAQLTRVITLPAQRGRVFDRNRTVLVTDIDAYSLYAHPKQVTLISPAMAEQLDMAPAQIGSLLHRGAPFVWIKRQMNSENKQAIDALKLKGYGFIRENRRLYLYQSTACHVIGFVGTDLSGLGGIEFSLNGELAGEPGKLIMESDPYGNQIASGMHIAQRPKHGKHVILTLDLRVQQALEEALQAGLQRTEAQRAMGIVMHCKTGEILGMAAIPVFNPNEFWKASDTQRKNPLVSDVYEPGSTFKVIPVAAGLNEGLITPASSFYCPNNLVVGSRTIGEAHPHEPSENLNKTVSDIIRESYNVGAAKIGLTIGSTVFEKYIYAFGFGQRTQIGLSGESKGIVRPARRWAESDKGIIAFGQGIAVTPIQLVTAYSAFINHGKMIRPRLIKRIENWDGSFIKGLVKEEIPVMTPETADAVKAMLIDVVAQGTGKPAQVPGFSVGGKTGTAQKARVGGLGYLPGQYVISFIGFLPASDPELLILTILDDPQKEKWGSSGAAPVFAEVARACVSILGLAPDQMPTPLLYTEKNAPKANPVFVNPDYSRI